MTHPKADGLDALKREAVQWYKERFDRSDIIGMPSDREVLFDFIDHLAQRGMILQEGWVAVPKEPSSEQINAAIKIALNTSVSSSAGWDGYMKALYKTILAAAPKMEGKE